MAVSISIAILYFTALSGCISSPAPAYDTIVVGLGSAGTTAATTLARAGRRVLALEAQPRVGGRVFTKRFGDGVVETGAEWIHGQVNSRVYELAVQNNIPVVIQNFTMKVYRSDGSGDSEFLTDLMMYGLEVMDEGSDVNESMGDFIEKKLNEHLQTTNPQFLNDTESYNNFLDVMSLMVGSYEASNDWHDVTALKGYESLEGSSTTSWHRYGYKTFFEILLNTYNGGPGLPSLDIKLNKPVTSIEWPQREGSSVVVTCADGARFSAPHVIVTVSLGVLKERYSTLFTPPLPQEKIEAIKDLNIGVVDKIILQFDEPWPVDDAVMFYWKPEDKKQIPDEDKWITKILGTSAPAGSNNTLTLWLIGDNAKYVETLPEEVVKRKTMELLQRFVGPSVTVPQPTDLIRTTWYSNEWTRGSYSFDSPAAAGRALRRALAAPLRDAGGAPRVLFAGEATDDTHFSTVHGASDSGLREARRLLDHS